MYKHPLEAMHGPRLHSSPRLPERERALAVIVDEHRALAAVLDAAARLLDETGPAPDFGLLELIVFFLKKFPESLHHPKEDRYLFSRLRRRTHAVDDALDTLLGEHADRSLMEQLEHALAQFRAAAPGAAARFGAALDAYSQAQFSHMALEESVILPAACAHLGEDDWRVIAAAFDENRTAGDDDLADPLYMELFSKIMREAGRAKLGPRQGVETCNMLVECVGLFTPIN